ncbi:hypothetical protein HMPREF9714_02154 [Myroides odoratimimus CCUG 12901]|uniref:N-acetyltransferase domain-containing protein n=1 Tax=Myroides odoratimimus CCUG 10230 TaxID=883150 RepID=A0ABN0EAI9_9FLAO|nr:GNAT family protein [Myroides odoratimimus]EHO08783.1 hypothetical protein HMPREF9714_02154 [Myroides odoratimimus CCUG 12901]EHO10189.1 hypothetical protein HMPREF9712_01294 [Myroides odoratimimus CCUG 10230]
MNKNRLYLRSLDIEDSIQTYKWRQDLVYQNGIVSQIRYTNLETEKEWINQAIKNHNSGKELRFAIVEIETKNIVGMVYLTSINYINRTGVMGYLIGEESSRGKGYAKEAVEVLLDYVFMELGLNRISATVLSNNESSLRVMNKLGFIREGCLREAVYKNGKYIDLISFSLLRKEFYQSTKNI